MPEFSPLCEHVNTGIYPVVPPLRSLRSMSIVQRLWPPQTGTELIELLL